ncbi:hypothetical protein AZ78_0426 [Lysobacter capsici AZ78]|uniref:Uncharacterized protein n=1 Tax=Lysobacter capsici AZ78 TaxID=1444315 RepID=A0A108U5E8_9GAMM|nr:hypothetical protein AZ78_0426 [Lysobacter capsici AZ78]
MIRFFVHDCIRLKRDTAMVCAGKGWQASNTVVRGRRTAHARPRYGPVCVRAA